jgi:hypothetical protein
MYSQWPSLVLHASAFTHPSDRLRMNLHIRALLTDSANVHEDEGFFQYYKKKLFHLENHQWWLVIMVMRRKLHKNSSLLMNDLDVKNSELVMMSA